MDNRIVVSRGIMQLKILIGEYSSCSAAAMSKGFERCGFL